MSEKKQETKSAKPQNNVVQLAAVKCTAEGCKTKPEKAGFCNEHYTWFKEGLLTIDGHKAKDFDKKYYAYMQRKKTA